MQHVKAIYENNVLKPLSPVQGIHERQLVELTISLPSGKTHLREIAGTLSPEEGKAMSQMIEQEFENIEDV